MSKKVNAQNYQNAYDILYGQWLSVHPTDHIDVDKNEGPLYSDNISSEEKITKMENFAALSSEAKEVIKAVLDAPTELLSLLGTPKTKKMTAKSVKAYFTRRWRSKFIADLTIKEITKWVTRL